MTERDDEEEVPAEDATQRDPGSDSPAAPASDPPSGSPVVAAAPDATRRGAELDDDSPESLRLTFVLLTALAGCLCILPRQWISAAILGGASAVLFVWHLFDRRRLKQRGAA